MPEEIRSDELELAKEVDYTALVFVDVNGETATIPLLHGMVVKRAGWEILKRRVDRFYAAVPDEQIVHINIARRDRGAEFHARTQHKGSGYIYFLRGGDYCKIGRTADLSRRIGELKIQLPFRAELFHSIRTSQPVEAERAFHDRFAEKRANGEWFELDDRDFEYIKSIKRYEPLCCLAVEALPDLASVYHLLIQDQLGRPFRVVDGALELAPGRFSATTDPSGFGDEFHSEIAELLEGRRCDMCGAPAGPHVPLPEIVPEYEQDED